MAFSSPKTAYNRVLKVQQPIKTARKSEINQKSYKIITVAPTYYGYLGARLEYDAISLLDENSDS